mgnify:FL=1
MKVGDLVKIIYNGRTRLVTKIEVRRSVPSNRMVTWVSLFGEEITFEQAALEAINASR